MNKNLIYFSNMDIIADGKVVKTIKNYSGQHYYPHSLADYAHSIKSFIQGKISSLPIMAVDCHDCYDCDFRCKDCLAEETKDWFKKNTNTFINRVEDFTKYKIALQKVAKFSQANGMSNVRFEMSGEGNPDLYPYRNEIIEYASQIGMYPVYISSGSYMDDNLCNTLVKYGSYIRISFPGISDYSYKKYSGQNRFLFKDAISCLRKLVNLRIKLNRENDLIIGVRCCLRSEMIDELETVTQILLDDIGIDTFQIVRAITNKELGTMKEENLISNEMKNILINLGNKKEVSIPDDLTLYYNTRKIDVNFKENYCFASALTPILYGNYLLPCTHTRMIREVQNKGLDLSQNDVKTDIYNMKKCETCCAIKDNMIFNTIYQTTKEMVKLEKHIEYHCY